MLQSRSMIASFEPGGAAQWEDSTARTGISPFSFPRKRKRPGAYVRGVTVLTSYSQLPVLQGQWLMDGVGVGANGRRAAPRFGWRLRSCTCFFFLLINTCINVLTFEAQAQSD